MGVSANLVPRVSHLTTWGERGDKMRDPGNEVGSQSPLSELSGSAPAVES